MNRSWWLATDRVSVLTGILLLVGGCASAESAPPSALTTDAESAPPSALTTDAESAPPSALCTTDAECASMFPEDGEPYGWFVRFGSLEEALRAYVEQEGEP